MPAGTPGRQGDLAEDGPEHDGPQALAERVERLVDAFNEQQMLLGRELITAVHRLARADEYRKRDPLPAGTASTASTAVPQPLAPRVAVYCLGEFKLVIDGQRVENWRAGKARALFQYLVTHGRRPIPRDELISALWPAPDALAAGSSLKVAVHALRQLLAQTGGADPPLNIQAHEASYALSGTDLWLDVAEFERAAALGRRLQHAGRTAEAAMVNARAADLYRGDFLADAWDDWVVFRREALKDQYLHIVAQLADAALAAGDYQACIARCQQILEKDNCREDSYRALMLCHARLGQRGRVRRWYEVCVQTLRTELDVAPEPETEQLYRRAIRGAV